MDETSIIIKAKIELARQLYQDARGRVKIIKHEVDVARRDKRELGMYEDCGEFYEHCYTEAKTKLS